MGWRSHLAKWLMDACPALALALLAACTVPAASAPQCRLIPVDVLSLRTQDGHPVVTVSVNGEPLSMLLDTGAETTVVSPLTAARLGLPHEAGQARIAGLDGVRLQDVVRATVSLTGKGRVLHLPVVDLPPDFANVGGIVGTDVLSDWDLDLDQPGGQLGLLRADRCGADDAPWPGRSVRLRAAFTPQNRVLVSVRAGAVPVEALLDTGVADAVLSAPAARRIGVTDAEMARGAESGMMGASLRPISMRAVVLHGVEIGPDLIANFPVIVPQQPFGDVAMLLGNDYVAGRRMLISWMRRAVFVRTNS